VTFSYRLGGKDVTFGGRHARSIHG
jgi:hypothetical protein